MVTKDELIKELQEKNIAERGILNETTKGDSWDYFSDGDKEEVYDAIFENIKRNRKGWTIRDVVFYKKGKYENSELMLVHQSALFN